MSAPLPCAQRALVDRHFAGRLRAGAEHQLREHLPGCTTCRAHYERHLLLAEVDPRALSARERLGRGLGLAASGAPAASTLRWWGPRLALAATAACAALLVLRPDADPDAGFSARGGSGAAGTHAAAPGPLQVYRVAPGGGAEPAGGTLRASDELAFSYRNAAGWAYLMVFAVDGGGHVFWYHPSWTDPRQNPASVPARAGEGPHELSEAVRQPLEGGPLQLYTLFSASPLTVREVEAQLARGGGAAPLAAAPGRALSQVTLQVGP